jgi:CheY-like chemotaxis protein/anti-sigma regulatory factor (Ser/Thr protein kinase)
VPTILVVDDSATDRTLVSGFLERKSDWSVRTCTDGQEALLSLAPPLPDVIVTDLQMPGMNGLELVRHVRDEWPFIPIILLTGKGSEDIAAEALRIGAASYVPKRHLSIALLETVQRILVAMQADRGSPLLQHYLLCSDQAFRLRNDLQHLEMLAGYVQQQLRSLPLGDEVERLRACLAFEEALTNACIHGNLELAHSPTFHRAELLEAIRARATQPPYCERHIEVHLHVDRTSATFTVQDEGRGFDHERLLQSAVLDNQDESSSRGLALMRTAFDEVAFNATGNQVTLIKRGIRADDPGDDDDESRELRVES